MHQKQHSRAIYYFVFKCRYRFGKSVLKGLGFMRWELLSGFPPLNGYTYLVNQVGGLRHFQMQHLIYCMAFFLKRSCRLRKSQDYRRLRYREGDIIASLKNGWLSYRFRYRFFKHKVAKIKKLLQIDLSNLGALYRQFTADFKTVSKKQWCLLETIELIFVYYFRKLDWTYCLETWHTGRDVEHKTFNSEINTYWSQLCMAGKTQLHYSYISRAMKNNISRILEPAVM